MDLPPILPVSSPFFCDIHHGQIQHFQKTVIRRKYRFGFRDFSELTVKSASQLGAYTVLANAKAMADKHPGYVVYDWNGRQVYPEVVEGAVSGMTNEDCPFVVKVSIPDLNIRKGAGTNTAKTGAYTGVGVFTIVEVKDGKGADAGWGRLKSGAGWIALDF